MIAHLTRPRQKYENGGPVIPPPKPYNAETFKRKSDLYLQAILGTQEKDFYRLKLKNEYEKAMKEEALSSDDALEWIDSRKKIYLTLKDEARRQGGQPAELPTSYGVESDINKYADGGRIGLEGGSDLFTLEAQGSKTGAQQIENAPKGWTSDKEMFDVIAALKIPVSKKIKLLADLQYGKYRDQMEYKDQDVYLDDPKSYRDRKLGVSYNEGGEGLSGHAKVNVDTGEPEAYIQWLKKFGKTKKMDGGRVVGRLKAFAPLAPYLIPYAAAFLGIAGATGLVLQQKIQNYFTNKPEAIPKFKEYLQTQNVDVDREPKNWSGSFTKEKADILSDDDPIGDMEKILTGQKLPNEDKADDLTHKTVTETPSGLVFGPNLGEIEKEKAAAKERLKPPVTHIPEQKWEPPKAPEAIETEQEYLPIPEQKGWQEFILYNKAIKKKIKDNAPAHKEKASDEYLDAVREGIELHDGNIAKAMKTYGLNREYVRGKFSQKGQIFEGKGGIIIETIKPIEETKIFKDYTTDLKKNPETIDENYNEGIKTKRLNKEDKYLNIQDTANAIGMDISTHGSKNQLLKLLEEDVRKTDPGRALPKKYHINDAINRIKEWSSGKKVTGEAVAGSERHKYIQKSDASLFDFNTKVLKRIRELTQLDETYLEDQIEDIGHPESVKTLAKYPKIAKNIDTIQNIIFQDPPINRDVIQTQGHAGDMDSIYKELNELRGQKNINNKLIKIQERIDARLQKTKKQIREHKEYTIGKNQDKRIARVKINLPKEGEAFTADNIGVDLSKVDKEWIMGKIDLINPKAKKFDDLNKNQKEIYQANLNDQYLKMIGKIYKEVGYGKGEIEDIKETISEGTHEKKGVLEKAKGGPVYGKYANQIKNLKV